VFPSYRSIQTESETEEERRLMYVAITRAKKNLFIVLAQQRMLFGQTQCNRPSRFLREISPDLLYLMGGRRERPADGSASSVSSPSRESARKVISSALSSQFDRKNDKAKKKEEGVLTPDDLTEGMKVVHPRFGEGVILKVEKVGGDALVTVDFDGMRKNMLAGSANLKKA
jgi:DNA helicase-2/ATP-dependent DNA helicase PcrA